MDKTRVEIYEEDGSVLELPDQWRWRLRAANNEIVAIGESYTSRADAVRGFVDAAKTMNAAVIEWFESSFGKRHLTESEIDATHSHGFRQGLGPDA